MNCKSLIRQAIVMLCSTVAVANAQSPGHTMEVATPIRLAVSSQPIAAALNDFARQSGLHVVIGSDVATGVKSTPVEGMFTRDAALQQLLRDTGLRYEYLDSQTVAVLGKEKPRAAVRDETRTLRVAQADVVAPSGTSALDSSPQDASSTSDRQRVEEIVVTATKRQERLIDVPQSVTVLSGDALTKAGALQFRDYADTVPGLSFQTEGAGTGQITLRGVSAGKDVSPTVGIYVDEVPYGSSSSFARASQYTLDAALFDIDRIEVLRGPQGTLYGASSLGGLLKYVSKRPDADSFDINVQAGIAGTQRGGANYHAAIAVNAPILQERAALRASSFYSRDGGYIDNVSLNQHDVNRSDIYGGRLDLLLTPSDNLSVRLNGFAQDIESDGFPYAHYSPAGVAVAGELAQRTVVPESSDQRFRLVSGTVTYDLGWANIVSISSYQTTRSETFRNQTARFAATCPTLLGRACSTVVSPTIATTDKFTQEIRLTSQASNHIEWLLGGFYTDERSQDHSDLIARDAAGQPLPVNYLFFRVPSQYEEAALFGDVTLKLTDQFDVTGGIRLASNATKFEQIGSGVLGLSAPKVDGSDDVLTYLANARYHFGEHATAYVRYATGYRPGGPNYALVGAKPTFEPDELKSYEIGFKAETADRRFGLDAAVYYIDWDNFITIFTIAGLGVLDNAPGGATVHGAEAAFTSRPIDPLSLTLGVAYLDAELSASDTRLRASKGDRLPGVPRVTAAFSADYELSNGKLRPTIGGSVRYIDDRVADFVNDGARPQYTFPDYTIADLRATMTLGTVNWQLYLRNVFDERGQMQSRLNPTNLNPLPVAIVQPRTIGLTASMSF